VSHAADSTRSPRVFISYAHDSTAVEAAALTRALSHRGAEVLGHEWNRSDPIREQISSRVAGADLVVVLIQPGDETRAWMEYETRLMLQAGWARPDMRVAVVAPAVRAIPAALRHQGFVRYFPHDEVRFSRWGSEGAVDTFASQLLGPQPKQATTPAMSDDEVRAWRNRIIHVVGAQEIPDAELDQLRQQLNEYLEELRSRLAADERFEPDASSQVLDRVMLAQEVGSPELAQQFYEVAQTLFARTFPSKAGRSADVEYRLGLIARNARDAETARRLFEDALGHNERELGESHPATIATLYNLGLVEAEAGDRLAAVRTYNVALERARDSLGDHHPQTAAIAYNLGILRSDLGATEDARELFTLAVDAYRHVRPEDSEELRAALAHLAALDASAP
jgi:tetratricopeptide (TPR) repeat protein